MKKPHLLSSWRTFVSISLVAMAIILTAAIWRLIDAALACKQDPTLEKYYVRMAYLMMAILLVTLLVLARWGLRWIITRFKTRPPVEPTSQVSAWVEAGKRFKLPEDDQDDQDDEDFISDV